MLIGDDGGCEWIAERPTLLGNIIATYELYPETRHGFSGVSFWHHLLYLAPEAARKDFASRVTLAEALLLGSAAGVAVTVLAIFTSITLAIGQALPPLIIGRSPLSGIELLAQLLFGLISSWALYRLALPAYRDTANAFCALTDLAAPKVWEFLGSAPTRPSKEEARQRATDVEGFLVFTLCREEPAQSSASAAEEG